MSTFWYALLLIIVYYSQTINGIERPKKVLVFMPISGHSHLKFMGTIANILQDEGYNVTLLLPILDEGLRDTTPLVRKIKNRILVEQSEELIEANAQFRAGGGRENTWVMNSGIIGFLKLGTKVANICKASCKNVFQNEDLINYLRDQRFDVAISEPLYTCGFALFDHLGIETTISTDSHLGLEVSKIAHGASISTSYLPAVFSSGSERMTLIGRAKNYVESYFNYYFNSKIYENELAGIEGIYKNGKGWRELSRKNAYMFVNSNPQMDIPSPRTSKFIEIGGISSGPVKQERLPEEYDRVLSLRKKNVLISFGTNAKSMFMSDDMKESLIKTFESMPDTTFIWKYENTTVDIVKQYNKRINNVMLTDWMPQTALLADPRLTLFVTHGGLGSTNEVAFSGKPSIMVPVFGDQTRNARMLERHEVALVLTKYDLTNFKKVRGTIRKMLNDKSYSMKAEKLAQMLRNQPESPKEIFIKYFNFVARFGKPHGLDSYAAEMSFIEFYYIDFMAILSIFSVALYMIVSKVLRASHNLTNLVSIKFKFD
ncbi:glucuronosyltransferase [Caenorhabditis elegans]|uniref:glucuronosyltransferase n=1 Tax=Caenorhabditis elegans TaxID=6239 RepID=O17757_CAEEL|nr:glucuronosyltransferase [Caenorhabditis elegans]CAB02884.1 glucuronosyltransferase [Caenorhabditis elegans]|eukprot:NP_501933.1 UDP-GlucuronosylTransferase [Caenorhabditis elegans]